MEDTAMDLHQLEYIVEIAKQNNISKAAELLHVSQPTLSVYLNRLEKQLNLKLFTRHNNVLTITDAGRKYVDTCSKILQLRDELYDDLYKNRQDSIHIGILSSNASLFSQVFMKFQPKHPDVTIRPVIDKSNRLYKLVQSGDLDFAYVTSYDEDYSRYYPDVDRTLVASYELVIFISKHNPVYSTLRLEQGVIPMEEISKLNTLTLSVATTLPMIKRRIEGQLMPKLGIHPKNISVMNNLEFLTTTIYLDNQFSIMPFSYIANSDFAKIMLPTHPQIYKILITPKGHQFTPAEHAFMKLAKEEFDKNPYYYYLQ